MLQDSGYETQFRSQNAPARENTPLCAERINICAPSTWQNWPLSWGEATKSAFTLSQELTLQPLLCGTSENSQGLNHFIKSSLQFHTMNEHGAFIQPTTLPAPRAPSLRRKEAFT
jgi:hypothetical protein